MTSRHNPASPKLFAVFFHVTGNGKRAVWARATGQYQAAVLSQRATASEIEQECTLTCKHLGFGGYRTGWGHSPDRIAWNGRRVRVMPDDGQGDD